MKELRRGRRRGWPLVLVAGVLAAASLGASSSASAQINANFCWNLVLSPGASCHSPNYHSLFVDIQGNGARTNPTLELPTCVGVDVTVNGPNIVNACSSLGVDCFSACSGTSGYAYIHNHGGTYNGRYYGNMVANS